MKLGTTGVDTDTNDDAIDWKHSFILEMNLRTVFENYPIQNVSG